VDGTAASDGCYYKKFAAVPSTADQTLARLQDQYPRQTSLQTFENNEFTSPRSGSEWL
jgi:hypothetical protein